MHTVSLGLSVMSEAETALLCHIYICLTEFFHTHTHKSLKIVPTNKKTVSAVSMPAHPDDSSIESSKSVLSMDEYCSESHLKAAFANVNCQQSIKLPLSVYVES